MTQINAYLNFDGNCREAMNFYKDCLGGELSLQTVEGSSIDIHYAAGIRQNILHSSLTRKGLILMGSDMIGPEGLNRGNNISLSLSCSTEEEINSFFSGLSAGGKIIEPLGLQFWGAMFGVLRDKFGIQWMLTYDKEIK
jgi:PhnB protein